MSLESKRTVHEKPTGRRSDDSGRSRVPVLGLVLALLPLLGPVVLVIELASEPDELHVIEQTMTRAEGPGTYRPPWAAVADDEAHPVEADSEQLVPDSASDTEEPETGGEQEAELDPS